MTKPTATELANRPEDVMYHFLPADRRLTNGDGRLVVPGQILKVDCKPVLCKSGLHASFRVIDALNNAPGPVLCEVNLRGEVIHGPGKSVGTERTVLRMADITTILHEMACVFAEDALALVPRPDPMSVAAIDARRRWLRGEITDQQLAVAAHAAGHAAARAARAAARAAAYVAAYVAGHGAAHVAGHGAAHEVAHVVGHEVAHMAAHAAGHEAAYDAHRTKQNDQLMALIATADWEQIEND